MTNFKCFTMSRLVLRAGHPTFHPMKTKVDVSFLRRKDDHLQRNSIAITRRILLVRLLHASMGFNVTKTVKWSFNYFVISQDESSILLMQIQPHFMQQKVTSRLSLWALTEYSRLTFSLLRSLLVVNDKEGVTWQAEDYCRDVSMSHTFVPSNLAKRLLRSTGFNTNIKLPEI